MKTRNNIILSVVPFAVIKANTVVQKDSGFINHCKLSNIYSKVSSLTSEESREFVKQQREMAALHLTETF